jgi:hypothetical protein
LDQNASGQLIERLAHFSRFKSLLLAIASASENLYFTLVNFQSAIIFLKSILSGEAVDFTSFVDFSSV